MQVAGARLGEWPQAPHQQQRTGHAWDRSSETVEELVLQTGSRQRFALTDPLLLPLVDR